MANKKQQEVLEQNETLNKSEAFILKNKKNIIIAVIAILAIIAGIFIYKGYISGPREERPAQPLDADRSISTPISTTRPSTVTEPTMPVS